MACLEAVMQHFIEAVVDAQGTHAKLPIRFGSSSHLALIHSVISWELILSQVLLTLSKSRPRMGITCDKRVHAVAINAVVTMLPFTVQN